MRRLKKPQKYSEINVEFYANEVTPVSQPAPTNSSTYQNPYGGFTPSGSSGSNRSNQTNKSNGLSFKEIFDSKKR